MSVVVSDTSPINYLLVTELIDLLPRLYGQVILPESVYSELLHEGSSELVRAWVKTPPEWLSVQKPSTSAIPGANRLHRGEIDAIALAEELGAGLVLMDDAAGVRFALARGLTTTGTLGVLVEAAQNGWVQIDLAIERLRATEFRATPQLFESAKKLAAAKPPTPPRRGPKSI